VGLLQHLQTLPTAPPDYTGSSQFVAAPIAGDHTNYPADICVNPNGRFLWVSNRGHPSVAGFAIDRHTGLLTANGYAMTGALQCWSVAITPDGNWLLAGLQTIDEIAAFSINQKTGQLTLRVSVPFPASVKIA
jgi:6-phosphogluconolactonase